MLAKPVDSTTSDTHTAEGYLTPAGEGVSELVEKKSVFIGRCAPVSERAAAAEYIGKIKSENRDASCNASAYYIRTDNITHSSDDGEPAGTAGVPVLNAITRSGVVDAVVVVTRFFGGTLLGAGGLVRAYSSAASAAVKNAGVAAMTLCETFEIRVGYPLYDALAAGLARIDARVEETLFSESVCVRCTVKKEMRGLLSDTVREISAGRAEAVRVAESYTVF